MHTENVLDIRTIVANEYAVKTSAVEWDVTDIVKNAIIGGISFIPSVGPAISFLVGLFWPQSKENIWEGIVKQIERMIEESALKTIKGILAGDIAYIQERMATVADLLDKHPGSEEARSAFNNLAENIDGYHKKFNNFSDDVNYQILPMFSTTVMMQITYWVAGLERRNEIGLSDIDIEKVRGLIKKTVEQANSYINNIYDRELNDALNNSTADTVANNVMSVHGHCRLHGIEYISIWDKLSEAESVNNRIYVDVLSYSTFFDRQTAKARIQALTPEKDMAPPLKPALNGGKRRKIDSLTGHIVRIGGAPRVGGLTVVFDDGNSHRLGTISGETASISLNGSRITSLEVWGNGAVDQAVFTLSDGRSLSFGAPGTSRYRKFYVGESHYIAGIYLSSDYSPLAGQAANIAVSYQLINDDEK
ncbi:insecticidal delta-endotoxin Cry8Ea1 family protein [Photorhabdus laumondii]|uniref:insecticidal delta-endotoxin Cry8Ea1 family protein n=1 Tax=Photorhabdus laumondii TaxID=2218628 RepID=UPI0025B22C2E|nr:insecticidal delta-endotoxin Cry8Ea1 family protein [Photorhabdus laumondii]